MSAITTCGAMLSSCSIAFGAELNGKTWCPFSRQSVTMTSTMAGSSSIITIFAMKSQRGEYFSFEKKKAKMRNSQTAILTPVRLTSKNGNVRPLTL
jgi:hypothetical protein